ncbi:MAG: acyl-CoA dehydrogenase, partial [Xanthomonadales bacterium]|nr:acyl-CoA dehydrogenase [Xanthomonadales bacterium]
MFDLSARAREIHERLLGFMREIVEPGEREYLAAIAQPGQRWEIPPAMEEMKRKARAAGLWNLFLPDSRHGAGLSNL